ncbi:MAG TPA: 50S ribosomal protein L28 [Actinobacteria bacterium]|nr:50S ribosomal protein L28 [Actinomycetota bacterium]
MSSKCEVCGKGPQFGKNVSHSHKKTLKTWKANIQNKRVVVDGKTKRTNVCTRCVKSNKVAKV